MRQAAIERNTKETQIKLEFNLDGRGKAEVNTGIGFLDHMLTLFAGHGLFDITVEAKGDLHIDDHHTAEDIMICLGKALDQALGDRRGIVRTAHSYVPMDEALAHVVLDFSGRPLLVWRAEIPKVVLGNLETEMIEEFFRAVASESGLTLHVRLLYGQNTHHIVEAIFKAFARALAEAVAIDARVKGVMSSKGKL